MSGDRFEGVGAHLQGGGELHEDAERALRREPRLEDALRDLRTAIEQSGVERAAALLKLAEEVERRAISYVQSIINHARAYRAYRLDNGDFRAKDRSETTDHARRLAHNALIDTLNALLRNSLKHDIEGAQPLAEQLAGHQDDADHRVRITEVALGYVYRQVLAEIERKEEETP